MLRHGDPLGVIVVGWAVPGPVSSVHEGLLKQFADQAVIALENVRLFTAEQHRTRELYEALEQQTATSARARYHKLFAGRARASVQRDVEQRATDL